MNASSMPSFFFPNKRSKRIAGPGGGPCWNKLSANGCNTQIVSSFRTRDKLMYALICRDRLACLSPSSASGRPCASAKTAGNVCPWIIWAVDEKSGTRKNPVRLACIFVFLFTSHVRDACVTGYMPLSKSLIRQSTPLNCTKMVTGCRDKMHSPSMYVFSVSGCNCQPTIRPRRPR